MNFKIGVREVNVIEGADGISDVYITAARNTSSVLLQEKLSEILKMSIIYSDTAPGGMMHFAPSGAFSAELYKKQIPKDEENVNGDTLIHFFCDNYKYYVLLCDGMGCGETAARESKITASMIEGYLSAGFSPTMALNLVNSSLVLKSDNEIFSSIDLLCLDLSAGQADFYKIGGSKSFFHRDGHTETIFSVSLPSGILPEAHISCTSKRLADGDIIIMMSDGVCDSTPGYISGERISKIIEKDSDSLENISEMILSSALKKKCNKAIDDMTIAAIKVSLT